MADAHTIRLCSQIIDSQFGPLAAKVAAVLLTRGRLPLLHLVRYSSLKVQTARAAVLILIQHNIVWHAQTEDDGEVLELNTHECLLRLRFGKFVWQAEKLFGNAAAEIIQLILDHGKLRPPEIFSHLTFDPKGNAVYSQILLRLVQGKYLKPATILSHVSPRDKRIRYEEEEKAKISGFPTAKQLREAKEAADARLKREEEVAESVGLTRKPKDNPGPLKSKRKTTTSEMIDVVDETVYFRVNFDKFNIHLRNILIEKAVRERFNDGAAMVIRAILTMTEPGQKDVNEVRSDAVSTSNVALQLADEVNLASGLAYASKKVSNTTSVKDYLGMLSSADNPTAAGRAASFVSFASSKVQVEFDIISRRLRRRVLEAVARERHGSEGVRIIRLLLDTGKMEDKEIAKVAMMDAKNVRSLLAALAADSFISTQEVPKSMDRNPTRTFYLWHVDLAKAYSVILGNLYKTLYNIGMRRQAELEEPLLKAVLEKRERSDVSQDESLLTALELQTISEWETKREKLTILEMRVEESVFILRDLGGQAIDDA
ncbi:RNA polymerase III subunit RPC82-domain-containing protein [Mycena floridula]|nr:RNA polymerase III subunit RPC82-domain-containing protein [Mycena floridula]